MLIAELNMAAAIALQLIVTTYSLSTFSGGYP
jgi:hypothetical protein